MQDRGIGVLVGLAAGDRIGGPIRMALQLGRSLLEKQQFDPGHVMQCYMDWWKSGGYDTGPTAAHVFQLIASGTPARKAARQAHVASGELTAGCNPAHRAAPLATAFFLPDESLREVAIAEAALTHFDSIAGDVSAVVVCLCRALIRGTKW